MVRWRLAKFTIQFGGPRATERLDYLTKMLEGNRAEVIRRALEMYEDAMLQRQREREGVAVTVRDAEERTLH